MLITIIKSYKYYILLGIILLIGLFFRTYGLIDRLEFAHDGDLSSWIVKDIVINHHPRLIGQLTSAQGIFIGPLFYYMLAPFHWIAGMDPIGGTAPVTILAMLTIASFYWVFTKLWNSKAGLIAAFLQAILLFHIIPDRSIVPTVFTPLWSIWYFFAVIMITRGQMKTFPLVGLLAGLIWHFHIALAPAFIAVPLALVLAKRFPSLKQIGLTIFLSLLPSIPLIVFELKHNFLQTHSFIANFSVDHGAGKGIPKLIDVVLMMSDNVVNLFLYPQSLPDEIRPILLLLLVAGGFAFLLKVKTVTWREVSVLAAWMLGLVLFFSFSSSPISEYYFASLEIIFIGIAALVMGYFITYKKWTMWIVIVILGCLLTKNGMAFMNRGESRFGYNARKTAAQFIVNDAKQKGYPCVAIAYQTIQGENVGFRYFFWLNNLHIIDQSAQSPTYIIAIPESMAGEPVDFQEGIVGVVAPENIDTADLSQVCAQPNKNLTEPLWGFTN